MAERNTRILLDGWQDGAVRSYGYLAGAEGLKNFLKGAAEVLLGRMREDAEQQGITVMAVSDPIQDIEAVSRMETALNVVGEEHLQISGSGDNFSLTYIGCPYARVCSGILEDLIASAVPQGALPCFRSETYLAALTTDGAHKARYVLRQFAPGEHCSAQFEII